MITCAKFIFNPLNAELNPTCHLLALLGDATIVVVSRLTLNLLTTTIDAPPSNASKWQVGFN